MFNFFFFFFFLITLEKRKIEHYKLYLNIIYIYIYINLIKCIYIVMKYFFTFILFKELYVTSYIHILFYF